MLWNTANEKLIHNIALQGNKIPIMHDSDVSGLEVVGRRQRLRLWVCERATLNCGSRLRCPTRPAHTLRHA